jgi:F-type H+-transporting ATPase subunit b
MFFCQHITLGLIEIDWQDLLPTIARTFNVLLFVALLYYILVRLFKLGDAYRGRQEEIRKDLMRAQEERNAAVERLKEVEGRLARLDTEIGAIRSQAQKEAAEERARIERSTDDEIRKIREQARREIDSAAKTARAELRAFAAEQSVKFAEELIRRDIRPEDDARLVGEYVEELGGARR